MMPGRKIIWECQYLFLRNMCIKWNSFGPSYEGSLHDDPKYPDRKDFAVLEDMEDPRVRAVMQREREYKQRHMHDVDEELLENPIR